MDTKSIEKFSIEARELLLNNMEQRLYTYGLDDAGRSEFGIDADVVRGTVLSPIEKGQRAELFRRVEDEGILTFVTEMAYTWFNRLAAIRYMELHGFLPSHVRMLSAADGGFDPECIHAAAALDLPGLERAEVSRLIQIGDDEALYRAILVAQCNELADFLPTVFGTVSADALTLPANLLHKSEFNVLYRLVTDIPEESWDDVEILGWMYQFYNSNVKAEFFKSKRKAGAADLAPATQLFTPDWIVRYMVDNSLGRLWMLNHPESGLKDRKADGLMEYYIEPDDEHEDFIRVTSPENITFCDPACGSGHILVYAFQMLMAIYEECGYREREIPELILTKNLSGFEIDPRAAQIATMALAFLAREHDRRFFGRGVTADITVLESVTFEEGELPEESPLAQNKQLTETLAHLGEVGSLYQPSEKDIDTVQEALAAIGPDSLFGASAVEKLERALTSMKALSRHFDVVVANPPYMGSSSFNPFMSKWIKKHYPDSCKDLCTAFIERGLHLTNKIGYLSMITASSWMFISSFEKFRIKLIDNNRIVSMIQQSTHGFPFVTVPTTMFTIQRNVSVSTGSYIRLEDFDRPQWQQPRALEAIQNPNCGWFYRADATTFHDIPGSPIAYWASEALRSAFRIGMPLSDYAKPRQGLATGDNNRFLREWWEVSRSAKKWVPCTKGGGFRKWYGDAEWIVDWSSDGKYLASFPGSVIRNLNYYFREGCTWGMISSSKVSLRFMSSSFVFTNAGLACIGDNHPQNLFVLALLNSSVVEQALGFLTPTMNFSNGDMGKLPVILSNRSPSEELSERCIELSKADWDSQETSWDFRRSPLL